MVQPDQGEFDRLEFLAWIASRLNRIEAGATARAEFYSANAIGRLLGEVAGHVRLGADAAVTDPAAIRAQFEADAVAEAAKPENVPLVQWAQREWHAPWCAISADGTSAACTCSTRREL